MELSRFSKKFRSLSEFHSGSLGNEQRNEHIAAAYY